MDEIIQIKCPFDGAILSIRKQPEIEKKNVTCPICKHSYPFVQYRRVVRASETAQDGPTQYPDTEEQQTGYAYGGNPGERTITGEINYTIGAVHLRGKDVSYQLKPGRNIIGRKGTKSTADFQIDTAGSRTMSREHIVIEVKNVPGKGFIHYLSLYKERVNATFVGSEPLLYGDCMVLNNKDVIKLPGADLLFEIPDDEKTDI